MLRLNTKHTFQLIAASAFAYSCSLSAAIASDTDSVASMASFNRYVLSDSNTTKPRQAEFYNKRLGVYFGASDAYIKPVDPERAEYDTYAGIAKKYGDLGYNLGVKAYNQTLHSDRTLNEVFLGGSYKLLNVGYASSDLGEYTQVSVNHKISDVKLELHMGSTMPEKGDSYYDWRIKAVKQYKGLMLNASLINRDVPTEYREEGPEFSLGLSRQLSLF